MFKRLLIITLMVHININKPEINVKISELWTLMLIPNFYANDGKSSAGMFCFNLSGSLFFLFPLL
ncbi:MAG: hypothetical protein HY026_00655 [Deltaproteobacteria bacterium]|nr:hypothetical protein [Deltaproteobacteria bacterium]